MRRIAFGGLVVALLAVVGFFLQGVPQGTCSCAVVDPDKAVAGAAAVFIGTPTKVLHGRDSDLYEFQVTEVFSGEVGAVTTVGTSTRTECNTAFVVGRPSLLLVSAPVSAGARWQAHGCGPDVSAAELRATAQITYGPAHPPRGDGAEITTWTRFTYKVPRTLQSLILAALGCIGVAGYATWELYRTQRSAPNESGEGDTIAE